MNPRHVLMHKKQLHKLTCPLIRIWIVFSRQFVYLHKRTKLCENILVHLTQLLLNFLHLIH